MTVLVVYRSGEQRTIVLSGDPAHGKALLLKVLEGIPVSDDGGRSLIVKGGPAIHLQEIGFLDTYSPGAEAVLKDFLQVGVRR